MKNSIITTHSLNGSLFSYIKNIPVLTAQG